MARNHRYVVAIGGNALSDPRKMAGAEEQGRKIEQVAIHLVDQMQRGISLLVVHGNGAQVGARLLQNEAARDEVAPSSLPVCIAETQGQLGHQFVLAISSELRRRELETDVACLITHVLVDPEALASEEPAKPIGPAYSDESVEALRRERGWTMARVEGGWRRVVPSPRPVAVLETEAITTLLDRSLCVVAGGGGGVPIVPAAEGFRAVEGVVDKDYTAERLASSIGASRLVILTDVPGVALSFSKEDERFLDHLSAKESELHLRRGEFAQGSMGPKVEACIEFVRNGGTEAVIAGIDDIQAALERRAGTRITLRG